MIRAGLVPHQEKSVWIPVQVLAWLGFVYDLIRNLILAEDEKLQRIVLLIDSFDHHKAILVKHISLIIGCVIALELSHGDLVHLRSKSLQIDVARAERWDSKILLSPESVAELKFWKENVGRYNK